MTNQSFQTTNIELINQLLDDAYQTRIHDLKKSVKSARKAKELAASISRKDLYARAVSMLAFFYMIQCKFKSSKKLSEESLQYFESQNDLDGIADTKFNIASIHYKTDHFHDGLLLLLDCQLIYKQLKNCEKEARVLKSMGTIYEYLDDVDSAVQAYKESAQLAKKGNNPNMESNAYNPLSGIYLNQGKIKEAQRLIEKSIKLKEANNDIRGLGFAYYGRGKIYTQTRKFELALADFKKSMEIHEEMGDLVGLSMTYNKMGVLYFQMKDLNHAKKYLEKALSLAKSNNIIAIEHKVYDLLYQIAKQHENPTKALKFLEKHIETKQKIINSRIKNVIESYKAIGNVQLLEKETIAQREKAEIIQQKNVELDSFFYRVSHDLKGPINSLHGLNQLIEVDVKDETALTYFDMYRKQVDRISRIVNELINLTKMNHQEVKKEKVNFHTIIDECINSYRHLPNFSNMSFIKDIDEGIEFYSEWPVLNTILQNLIENGIKYWREDAQKPYVHITVKSNHEHIIINSKDNGLGIEPKYQGRIFDMFYRANDNTAGTGLGLYILKRAVERLNGDVQLESEYRKGSNFKIRLPKSS